MLWKNIIGQEKVADWKTGTSGKFCVVWVEIRKSITYKSTTLLITLFNEEEFEYLGSHFDSSLIFNYEERYKDQNAICDLTFVFCC